jgi:chromosome segregation ATPase
VVVAPSIDEASALVSGQRLSAVTLDGDVIESEFVYRGGSNHKNVGLRVGLQDKLATLSNAIESHEDRIHTLELELTDLRKAYEGVNVDKLTVAVKDADQTLRGLENRFNSLQARKTVYEKNVSEIRERRDRAHEQIASSKAELEDMAPESESLHAKLDASIRRQVELRVELEGKEDARQKAQQVHNEHQLAASQA